MSDTHSASASPAAPPFTPKPPFFFELSRLMVVAINTSGRLVYKAQTKPNGPWEANWSPVESAHVFAYMAAGLTGDGRVAVVAQPTAPPELLYIDEKPNTSTQQWNAPVSLGKPAGSSTLNNLSMALDADGRVEVFAIGNNGAIWWKYQNPNRIVQKTVTITPPGTTTPITVTVDEIAPPLTPWSDWFQIPGGLIEVKALRSADGRIILFGINSGGNLYRNEQKVARAVQLSDWAGWVQMDNRASGTFVAGTIAPSLDRAGAVNLFAINGSADILHARQAPAGTPTWTGWTTPGIIRDRARAVAVGIDGDDHLVVVGTDINFLHNMTMQFDVEAQQWTPWMAFSFFGNGPPRTALDYNADGRLTFFSHLPPASPPPNAGGLWLKSQMAVDSTEWEWEWTLLAADSIRQFGVVRDLTP
jgi:hypothetical protein